MGKEPVTTGRGVGDLMQVPCENVGGTEGGYFIFQGATLTSQLFHRNINCKVKRSHLKKT
jgi:hypothetical protein